MPKHARVIAASGLYHVTARGNRRGAIYVDEHDYRRWESLLIRSIRRHGWRCLIYALLPNHYHLLLESTGDRLARGMNLLNGMYGQAFNRRHGYVGHVFQRRFDSEAVESDGHLLEAVRYIALNPVRAGLCERAEEWPWATYGASFGLRSDGGATAVTELLALFGRDRQTARRRLAAFVADGL